MKIFLPKRGKPLPEYTPALPACEISKNTESSSKSTVPNFIPSTKASISKISLDSKPYAIFIAHQ
jgi:hypothetical protein